MLNRTSHKKLKVTSKILNNLVKKGYNIEYEKSLKEYFIKKGNKYIYYDSNGCYQFKERNYRQYCVSSNSKKEAIQLLYESFLFAPEKINLDI